MEQPHNLPLKVYQDERDYMMVPGFHTGSLILICFFTGGIRGHPKWDNRLRGIWKGGCNTTPMANCPVRW